MARLSAVLALGAIFDPRNENISFFSVQTPDYLPLLRIPHKM